MSRYRRKAGQVMLDLLYGEGDHINREGPLTINISKMAQSMHMRPVRLLEALEWLTEVGMLAEVNVGRYEAVIGLVVPLMPYQEDDTNLPKQKIAAGKIVAETLVTPDEWISDLPEDLKEQNEKKRIVIQVNKHKSNEFGW